jgi:hypothetical protein
MTFALSLPQDVYFSVPGVATVRWDEGHKTVFVEWEGWANTAEFDALLDAEVRALEDHGGSCLLADCRKQRVLNLADQERANLEWVPKAIAAGLLRFAIVLPVSEVAAAHLRSRLEKVPQGLQVEYFGSVDEAREWIAR